MLIGGAGGGTDAGQTRIRMVRAPDYPYRSSTHPPKTKNSHTTSWRVFVESSSFSALFDEVEEP